MLFALVGSHAYNITFCCRTGSLRLPQWVYKGEVRGGKIALYSPCSVSLGKHAVLVGACATCTESIFPVTLHCPGGLKYTAMTLTRKQQWQTRVETAAVRACWTVHDKQQCRAGVGWWDGDPVLQAILGGV